MVALMLAVLGCVQVICLSLWLGELLTLTQRRFVLLDVRASEQLRSRGDMESYLASAWLLLPPRTDHAAPYRQDVETASIICELAAAADISITADEYSCD